MRASIVGKREDVIEFCRRYAVARLAVFDSVARGTDFNPGTSDADFLVGFSSDGGLGSFD